MCKSIASLLTVHNRKDKTLSCLSQLINQNIEDGYIIDVYLTDDGCTDGTYNAVKKKFPEVNLIKGNGNLFWNRGMYTAWEAASKIKVYDYFLWLNDDTLIYKNALSKLLECAEKYENKSIIIGSTVDTATHRNITYGGRINGMVPKPNGESIEVDYFNGNIVLVPQYVYKILGNLDNYFTHSKGDFDYGMRAKKQNIKMYQVGEPLGECDVHEVLDLWCNPKVPFKKRWDMLYRPNGMPPKETFYLEKRHYGLFIASFHYLTVHLRCILPQIWNIKFL